MVNPLFKDQTDIKVRALFVGQRIDLRAFEHAHRLASAPLLVSAGALGAAVLFRYGVVVLFGLSAIEEVSFLSDIQSLIVKPFKEVESEEVELVRDAHEQEGVKQSRIVLHEFSLARLQLVAGVLAKSVVLGHYEANLATTFDRIEPLAEELQHGRKVGSQGRQLLGHIGDALSIQGKMVGRVEVAEKPELLWEHPEMERLYLRLEDEYELRDRHLALERKLDLISRTAETLLGLLQDKRTLRVEWYIVILIVVEIVLYVYELVV